MLSELQASRLDALFKRLGSTRRLPRFYFQIGLDEELTSLEFEFFIRGCITRGLVVLLDDPLHF